MPIWQSLSVINQVFTFGDKHNMQLEEIKKWLYQNFVIEEDFLRTTNIHDIK